MGTGDANVVAAVQVGGAKLEADDARRIRETLTPGLQQVFGMAEGLLCYTRPERPTGTLDRTQGRPLSADDELRIVDDAGLPVPDGAEGELLVPGSVHDQRILPRRKRRRAQL